MSNKTCRLCLFVVYPAITIRARITTPAILVCSLRVRKPSEINIKIFFFNTDDVLDGLYALDIIIIIELSFCFVYISGKNRVSYVRIFAIPHYRSRVTQERVTITQRHVTCSIFFYILKLTLFSSALQVSTSGVRNSLMFCLPHGVGEARS